MTLGWCHSTHQAGQGLLRPHYLLLYRMSRTLYSDDGVSWQDMPGCVDDARVAAVVLSTNWLDDEPASFDSLTTTKPRHLRGPSTTRRIAARQQQTSTEWRETRRALHDTHWARLYTVNRCPLVQYNKEENKGLAPPIGVASYGAMRHVPHGDCIPIWQFLFTHISSLLYLCMRKISVIYVSFSWTRAVTLATPLPPPPFVFICRLQDYGMNEGCGQPAPTLT